jgi:hypothetical protein
MKALGYHLPETITLLPRDLSPVVWTARNCKKNKTSFDKDRTWRYEEALFKEHRNVPKKWTSVGGIRVNQQLTKERTVYVSKLFTKEERKEHNLFRTIAKYVCRTF